MNNIKIKEALVFGWQGTNDNFWFFIRLLPLIIFVRLMISFLSSSVEDSMGFMVALITIISLVIQTIINMGITTSMLRIAKGEKPIFKEIFQTVQQFWPYLGASILVGIIVMVGFILLIVPGIVLALSLQFYTYIIIDQKLGPIASLWRSWEITKGSRLTLFGLALVLFLLNVAGVLLLGIGLFWTIPMSMLAITYCYRTLNGQTIPIVNNPVTAPI